MPSPTDRQQEISSLTAQAGCTTIRPGHRQPPPAVTGQALPYRRRGMPAGEPMGCVMGELYVVDLILFVFATFAAAFVTGLAGFAFAIFAAAVWLHFLPPAQCTALI